MTTVFYKFSPCIPLTFVVLCSQSAKALDDFADGIKVNVDFVLKTFLKMACCSCHLYSFLF